MNCGQYNHADDCLCDVGVSGKTPISFGLTELWHGERVARSLGLGVPWTGATFMDCMAALTYAYDIWSRDQMVRRGTPIEGEVLRGRVVDLLQSGESMVDMATLLDVPFKTIIETMTDGKRSSIWDWDDVEWLRAEAIIHDNFCEHGRQTLATMVGVTERIVSRLAEWYGVAVNQNAADRLTAMKGVLVECFDLGEAVERIRFLGYECNVAQLRELQRRMVVCGAPVAA